jgi:hypothetical protein
MPVPCVFCATHLKGERPGETMNDEKFFDVLKSLNRDGLINLIDAVSTGPELSTILLMSTYTI